MYLRAAIKIVSYNQSFPFIQWQCKKKKSQIFHADGKERKEHEYWKNLDGDGIAQGLDETPVA